MLKAAITAAQEAELGQEYDANPDQFNPGKDDGQIVMLVDPNCDMCEVMKKAFSSAIEAGFIETISVKTDMGEKLMRQLNIAIVPVFLVMVDETVFSGAEVVAAAPTEEPRAV